MSLRARLLISLLIGVTLTLVAGGTALYFLTADRMSTEFRAALATQARALAALVVVDHGQIELEVPAKSGALRFDYRIVDADGAVVAEDGSFQWDGAQPPLPPPGDFAWAHVELPEDRDGLAVIHGFRPHLEDAEAAESPPTPTTAPVWITLVQSTETLDRNIATVGSAMAGLGLYVLVTTMVIVWLVVRASLRPLDRYIAAIEDLEPDALELAPPPTGTPSELRPAYDALGSALDRVRNTIERERRFTDAAAHELRTPIAELRTTLDVAKRWPEGERIDRSLARADEVLVRMTDLIETLLQLSRPSSDLAAHNADLDSVAKIVQEECDRASARAATTGIMIAVSMTNDWRCSRYGGQIIIRNLLENAIDYTPKGGRIDIQVHGNSLRIANGPVELDQESISRLFEPFWRADAARSERNHHGLGLAIVRHTAAGCGLTCRADLDGDTLVLTLSPADVSQG
ncbi:MAG: sensor histidine kinase N-terminal domain-containing protein [Phycisphaerales bacterium]|nr:sensor histidine kinase N-terminal domain-containing protein [Phycisphaerales bacterium]